MVCTRSRYIRMELYKKYYICIIDRLSINKFYWVIFIDFAFLDRRELVGGDPEWLDGVSDRIESDRDLSHRSRASMSSITVDSSEGLQPERD